MKGRAAVERATVGGTSGGAVSVPPLSVAATFAVGSYL